MLWLVLWGHGAVESPHEVPGQEAHDRPERGPVDRICDNRNGHLGGSGLADGGVDPSGKSKARHPGGHATEEDISASRALKEYPKGEPGADQEGLDVREAHLKK